MHQHRIHESAPPPAPRWVESTKRVVRAPAKLGRLRSCPRQANGALSSALLHRAGAGFDVALLVFAVACTGFRVHQHRINESAPPPAPRWFESTKRVVRAPAKLGRLRSCPRQANGALSSALLHRAGAGCDVALLVFAVACTGFRVHQHRINESAPPPAPRWVESTKRVVRAPAKLGRLRSCPKQANGALSSALLHRAGAGFDVALLVFAVACTGFRVHQHRIHESAPPPAPRWFESTKRVVRAPVKLGRLRSCPRQANGALSSALLHRAGAGCDVALLVFAVACTGFRVHQHRINESAPPPAPRWFESTKRVVRAPAKLGRLRSCPRQANGALSSALLHRAGAGFDVALLVFAVACTGFRVHQHRINESAPPPAPRWVESTKRVVRAPAKLGRLRSCPRQANGALSSALLHRAGAGFDVALLVFAVACTVVSRAPTPNERECATACATVG